MDTASFEARIGYVFRDKSLLVTALTHRSALTDRTHSLHNERLEFLGDSVLQLSVSTFIYNKFPNLPEGRLTRIRAAAVCEASLASCAEILGLGEYLLMGKGEELTGGRQKPSILSDAFEALLGAIYLDGGYTAADRLVLGMLSDVIDGNMTDDAKSLLQEMVQAHGGTVTYSLVSEEGPPHMRTFTAAALIDGKEIAQGSAGSKKAAEREAAAKALKILEKGVSDA